MGFATTAAQITPQSGSNSQILITEQAGWGDDGNITDLSARVQPATGVPTGGDLYRYQPLINSVDLSTEGENIATNYFDGSAAANKMVSGPIDITNGMIIALSGNGTALPFRMLTQDKNPSWNILGGTGQTIPAEVTIVADTASLTTTAAATIADGSPSVATEANSVQVTVNPDSGTLDSGRTYGAVTITGTDYADRVITEELRFPAGSSLNDALTTRLWFKTITEVKAEDGWATGTYEVTATDRAAQVVFTPQDQDLAIYWGAEVAKGQVASLYRSLIMNEASIAITRDELIAMECSFMGRRAYPYQNWAGDTGTSATPSTRGTGVELASSDVFASINTIIRAGGPDGPRFAVTDATVTISQNIEYTNVLGSRYQVTAPLRGDKRSIMIDLTVLYSSQNDFSEVFRNNEVLRDVAVEFNHVGLGAFPYKTVFEIDYAQISSDPDPSVAGFGQIDQSISLKGYREGGTGSDFRIRSNYSNYDRVRTYS